MALTTQVVVTIAGRQWSCLLHSYQVDMTSYYSQSSIPINTGFVSDFGSDQQFSNIQIDPNAFGFNPDIALVTTAGQIIQIIRGLKTLPQPVMFTGIARYFISVNANEMSGISLGSLATIILPEVGGGFDISTILASFIPFIMLMMVMGMVMPMTKGLVESKA